MPICGSAVPLHRANHSRVASTRTAVVDLHRVFRSPSRATPTGSFRLLGPTKRPLGYRDSLERRRDLAVLRESERPSRAVTCAGAIHGTRGNALAATACFCTENAGTPMLGAKNTRRPPQESRARRTAPCARIDAAHRAGAAAMPISALDGIVRMGESEIGVVNMGLTVDRRGEPYRCTSCRCR